GCIAAEPALALLRHKIAGGLRLPNDETGDCFKFTNALADIAAELGVTFAYGQSITDIHHSSGRIDGVRMSTGLITADAYVVALGSYAPKLLRPLGMTLPVYPVKGYSLTAPVTDPDLAPVSTV